MQLAIIIQWGIVGRGLYYTQMYSIYSYIFGIPLLDFYNPKCMEYVVSNPLKSSTNMDFNRQTLISVAEPVEFNIFNVRLQKI